ncbi:ABC transporter permease subunit [Wenxinia saemankumensis]|uniref:Oligopeptide transport system permease protein OppC n=1 Tax=Wenxinia saemankumensis TaxID=1447782 RepID=A0A1M6GYJ1_9RHOB|nr:ABC transporter permease subunit [Wenxinia saemankumensis]SHJ14984.1 oligopeptide transport system permease protein [Wenxinia saemankumensis]
MTEPRNPGTDTRDIDHIESEKHGEPQAEILDATGELGEVKGRSLWADARMRFFRNKAAVFSLGVLGLVMLFAFFGGFLAQYDPAQVDFSLMGANAYRGVPSIETGHYFGTDVDGRDLYARTVIGTRISLLVGIVGALVAVIVGTLYGATAGYVGGRTDQIMMRIVDVLMSIPFMFVLILMLVIFGRSILMLFIGIGLISWLDMARIARGQTLSIKNKEFVEAAVATGVSSWRIILRHVVPNLLGIVIVYATLLVPGMIIFESFISYLGLGIQEPMTSLGALINLGTAQMNNGTLWMLLFPLAFFLVLLFALFFVGDGLRDALDPKDR